MSSFFFLFLLAMLGFMFIQNRRLLKRSKHVKNYVGCSDAVFNDDPDMVEIGKAYVEGEADDEFANKGRVIYIYALLHKGIDAKEEAAKLDLKETLLNKKGKFDAKKFDYNSDTYFWIIISLIKAHTLGEKAVVDDLVRAVEKHYDFISQDIVVKLFFAVHRCLSEDDKTADVAFLSDLWAGNYPAGSTYDKRLIGFYKYLAVTTLAKIGEPLSEEMTADVRNFAGMKAGRLILRDFGILDDFYEAPVEDDVPAIEGEEDVIDVEAEVVESDDVATEEVAESETSEDEVLTKESD